MAAHELGRRVCVGLSGGADSLSLTAASVRAGLDVCALVVDHGLQDGSAQVASRAARAAERLGARAQVITVEVSGSGGMEAAARDARYRALAEHRGERPVLLAHTLDDQAETVLLGLARGSGPRSIAGMRPWSRPWGRPLLGVRRARTRAACDEMGLVPHEDPHNVDPRFTRVRLRTEVLPLLEEVCQGGVAQALARTARLLREDIDCLDDVAAHQQVDGEEVAVADLAAHPPAIRRRVLRLWLGRWNTAPTASVIDAVDALIVDWHGQGPVAIGGDPQWRISIVRRDGVLSALRSARDQ
ncbi:tRNA lysidine(34) synthetase TilS [Gordonia jinhuaensis]|uniref:tRNA(Ile)-lysidine synthase n=1 Tax=Gordonia jinhuaensis TaxID=1517702 RepID=A0A916WYJ7_9ACTN|nr:tRNA lysidine(34) synthetase TilS [Gordonia jinhuaensis]GGB39467.1 tRNA(Ile)-lysidine synthase [Gordonia jinhuaensis]